MRAQTLYKAEDEPESSYSSTGTHRVAQHCLANQLEVNVILKGLQ